METIVSHDSPLAAYLNGEDSDDDLHIAQFQQQLASEHGPRTDPPPSYAPRGLPRMLVRLPTTRIYKSIHDKPLARLREWYGYLVASTLGSADNVHFLEHFRYILIASQLLDAHIAPGTSRPDVLPISTKAQYGNAAASLVGAAVSATLAFAMVWALSWARADRHTLFSKSRLALVVSLFIVAGILLYGYVRREWLQHLRHQVITTASDFAASARNFEGTTSSTMSLIQEVELVSRGYRLSTPLPPITRLESAGQSRRCVRLRKRLRTTYTTVLPAFAEAAKRLRPHVDEDDLERFLDVYDVRQEDVDEAMTEGPAKCEEDEESLRHLRGQQARLSTLRRLVLCSLLSVPATGRQIDAVRWRVCVTEMDNLRGILSEKAEKIGKLLHDDDHLHPTSSPSPLTSSPLFTRTSSSQTTTHPASRRISVLSTGIRSIQAKLYLLREDSTRALSSSHSEPDLLTLSTTLRDQYDAIGSDLRSLMHAWETGRQALVDDITKQERRVSRTSSSLRSSLPSLGGLTAVEEDDDSGGPGSMSPRTSALRKLTGEGNIGGDRPETPPVTESEDEGRSAGGDEDVFEAVAAPLQPPRQRGGALSREQRIAKMVEERERLAALREKRDASTNMIRELQTVIHLRPSHRRNTVIGAGLDGRRTGSVKKL